jgi:hypothetical protein
LAAEWPPPRIRGGGQGTFRGGDQVSELKDYSGSYIPDVEYDLFSREMLIKLIVELNRAVIMMDGFWQTRIAKMYGNEQGDALGTEVWSKEYPRHIIPRIMKVLNIQGNDVETLMKYWQLDPSMGKGVLKWEIELISKNHAVWTVTHCPALLYMEKEGKGREALACTKLEPAAIQAYADVVNPKIRIRPLLIPPRKDKDVTPHCQWEFKLEE